MEKEEEKGEEQERSSLIDDELLEFADLSLEI